MGQPPLEEVVQIVSFLRDWVIPIAAVLLSVWFAASAKRDADNAQKVLGKINDAIQGWQAEIMKSSTELLNTTPQIVDGKLRLANAETRNKAVEVALGIIKKTMEDGSSPYVESEMVRQLGSIARQLGKIDE